MESLAAALKNNKQQEETNKLLKAILKGQEDERKDRKRAEAKRDRMSRLVGADPQAKKRSTSGSAQSEAKKSGLFGLGNLFKGLDWGKILGIAGIGAGLTAYIGSEKFRKFVNDNILGPIGTAMKNAFFDFFMKDAPWKKNLRQGIIDFFVKDAQWKKDMRKGFVDFFVKDAQWKKDIRGGFVDFFIKDAPWKKSMRDGIRDWFVEDAPWKQSMRQGFVDFFIKDAPWKQTVTDGLGNIMNTIGEGFKFIFDKFAERMIPGYSAAKGAFGGIKGGLDKLAEVGQRGTDSVRKNIFGESDRTIGLINSSSKYSGQNGKLHGLMIDYSQEVDTLNRRIATDTSQMSGLKTPEARASWQAKIDKSQARIDELNKKIESLRNARDMMPSLAKGGWITGPQSGYPVSLTGQGVDFIGHGTEYVAMKSNGGFVIPFDTPHTRMDPSLTGRRMGEAMRMGFSAGGRIVEHLHGDPGRPGYEPAGHGSPTNAHDHFAFDSKSTRDLVISGLKAKGYQIGSVDRPGDPGWHGAERAVDIPWSQFGSGAIGENDYRQSRQLLADVKAILGDSSSTPSSSTSSAPGTSLFSGNGMQNMMKSIDSILDTPIYQLIGNAFGSIESMVGNLFGGFGSMLSDSPSSSSLSAPSGGTGPVNMGKDINEKLMKTAKLAMEAGFTKEQAKTMAAIAGGESSFNNRAFNGTGADQSYGLWQINMLGAMGPERRNMLGISSNEELFDPKVNARAAKMIFDQQGFGAWGAYKDGNAAKYMNAAQNLELSRGGRVDGVRTPMAGPDPNELLRELNQKASRGMSSSSQPIIIPMGGGGGGGQMADEGTVPTMPAGIPNNPGNNFQLSLVMTRNLLSANIGG